MQAKANLTPRAMPPATRKQFDHRALSDSDALKLVMEMMAIPGRSGEEAAIMDYIRGKLHDAGATASSMRVDDIHRRTPVAGQTGNLVLKLPGTVRGPRRMISAHVDTVPICVGSRPVRKGKRIVSADPATGLGADDRSGAAVLLSTAIAILRGEVDHPPLTLLWTVQEEIGLHGARLATLGLLGKPRLAFNFDGGSPAKITIGATGGYRMSIDIRGIASHAGGAPAEGVSAVAIASLAVADLVSSGWHGAIEKDGHTGTSNVGVNSRRRGDERRGGSRSDPRRSAEPRPKISRPNRQGDSPCV